MSIERHDEMVAITARWLLQTQKFRYAFTEYTIPGTRLRIDAVGFDEVIGVQADTGVNVWVAECKTSRVDLVEAIRAGKMTSYRPGGSHCVLVVGREVITTNARIRIRGHRDGRALVVAEMVALGVPPEWGLAVCHTGEWAAVEMVRPPARVGTVTAEQMAASLAILARRSSLRAVGVGIPRHRRASS